MFCLAVTGSIHMPDSDLLNGRKILKQPGLLKEAGSRSLIVRLAENELQVRELTGKNDGKRVEAYLALVNLHKGDPYCAAFVSYIFAKAGFPGPRSGWSPDLFPAARICHNPVPGNIIGIYFPEFRRIAHVGIIENMHHNWCLSIEANTNVIGSREGQGVYRRLRHVKTIYRMADWILPGRRSP